MMQALRSSLPSLALYTRGASGMPRRGLFIGMCYPQQEFFSKRPGTELQADGEVVGRKSTGERDGRQRRQGTTTRIGTPEEEVCDHRGVGIQYEVAINARAVGG